jgi:ferredoxin
VNTVFDTSKCVACNGCVDVCPENLIRLVGLSKLIENPDWMERAVEAFGDLSQYSSEQLDGMAGAMMKDETTCIRCAMCASRCPTAAILMKEFEFYRECVAVAARNPKVAYGPCA